MDQDFFTNLPSEIIINILARLPVRTIIRCKCVCKSWLHLLGTHEFVKTRHSRSVPGLAVQEFGSSNLTRIFEFEDGLDLEHHELHYIPVTEFILPHKGSIEGSANGLLFLRDLSFKPNDLYIYNSITRDYVKLHCPKEFHYKYPEVVTYGFGVSHVSGQYKVVRIFHDGSLDRETYRSECHVYTLGTGSWRRIEPGAPLTYSCRTIGAFFNENLHWLASGSNNSTLISCFDLESEVFSAFSAPPLPAHEKLLGHLSALEDCLCLCDSSSEEEIVIWLMKKYGDEKSWTKEFVIRKSPNYSGECFEVVQIFKDGDILMSWEDVFMFYYSNKTKTTKDIDTFALRRLESIYSILHTSSFLSLKNFALEKVQSF